ncbi:anoctamin-10-like [Porites lutea]|uniref:anoctamin-10-like n=1 Tax=Porites lutea TaxID=51062 RepID=UPI003CC6B39D
MAAGEYLVCFSEKCEKEEVKQYFVDCLSRAKFSVTREEFEGKTLLTVDAPFRILANKAEDVGLKKTTKNENKVKEFVTEELDKFAGSDNQETFFTPAERVYLLEICLESVQYDKEHLASYSIKFRGEDSFITDCLHSKPPILESAFPLHHPHEQEKIWKKMKQNVIVCPLQEIRDYYGESVAFYFGWMTCFTWTLVPIAFVGILLYFFKPRGVTVDDNPLLPVYEILTAFWAISFLAIWKRKESEYSFLWRTHGLEKSELLRPEFTGKMQPSPITGQPEKYFPRWKRWLRYGLSFVLTLPVLALAVGAMLCSLNFNGYIKDKESPVYIAAFAYFAEPGHIFAADNEYYGYLIPTIGHSVVINILNKLYRSVAHFCTDLENHRTERDWDNSLIIKRVLFEVFDCFLPLFYIAFYQLNVVALRRELVGLFWGDEIRRLITESLVPYVTEKGHVWKIRREYAKSKKDSDEKPFIPSQAQQDIVLEEYEQFDDYLEMVVQFGYVTLFASAFPLAAAVSILFLFIEGRADLFKLLYMYQRPKVRRVANIGVWFNVLYCMMVLSMLTNSLIVGFSSEQLAVWCPWMYETIDNDQFIINGYGRYVVAIVFCIEHFLILCAVISRCLVSEKPKWVRIAIAKEEYEKAQEAKERKEKHE